MIDFPEPQEIEMLRQFKEPFCLTIYVPLLERNTWVNPIRIELKNLLREARVALLSAGVKPRDIRKTLAPARLLVEDHEFWPMHRESLVLFMHPKLFRYYNVPDHSTPYMLTVERGFNLDPLLKVMSENRSYFVLALGHKDVKLYEGDHFSLKPVKLQNFPGDMKEALHIDEYPRSLETHTIAPASSGKGSEAFHQQYNVAEVDKTMLEEFFRIIDRRLHFYLSSTHKPLILAGVNYLLPIYRKVNTYSYLWPKNIKGNVKDDRPEQIINKAWPLVGIGGAK